MAIIRGEGETVTRITVVVVSDYESGAVKTWEDERALLHHLAAQDIREPYDVVFVENRKWSSAAPEDLHQIYPRVIFRFVNQTYSAGMLNAVIPEISTEYIALMEADCLPSTNWLRKTVEILDINPGISAVSGKTLYGRNTAAERIFSLLHRAYADMGCSGQTKYIANNGAMYRREVLIEYPYPVSITPFASAWKRILQMRNNNLNMYFEASTEMTHAFDGIGFVMDYHRNHGYAAMSVLENPGYLCIPHLLRTSLDMKLTSLIEKGREYLHWHDYPLVFFLVFILPFLEIPGMVDCVTQKQIITNTAYR